MSWDHYLVKVQIRSFEGWSQTLVRSTSEENARVDVQMKWPNDEVEVLSVERCVLGTDYGTCEEHDYPLDKHCDSCERIYCEYCDYGD